MRRYAVAVVSALLAVGTLWLGMLPADASSADESPPTTPPWSITPTPDLSGTAGFSGVSCTTATACMAVGSSSAGVGRTVTESWNGDDWSVIPSLDENDKND